LERQQFLAILEPMKSLKALPDSFYPRHPVVAVGAVVIHKQRVLLVKRKYPPNKDTWAIPGGKVALGETLQQAAERELIEETGITIKAEDPVYTFDVVEYDTENRIRFHYVIIDLKARYIEGALKASDDAADAGWISSKTMTTLPVNSITRRLLKRKFGFGP
jgi:8-oxo-dGTP diphosphatase